MHGIALLTSPREITLTRPSAPGRTRRGVRVHRAAIPTGHLTELDGVPVTTAARTVIDLARRLPFRDAVVAADSAMYRLRLSSTQLERVLADCPRWPGSAAAAKVLAASHPKARSPLETLGRLMCADHGLPAPEIGIYIGDDQPYTEADLLWSRYKVIVLLDGMLKYDNAPGQNRKEKLTQERLENDGFIVVRLTWNDVVNHPARSVARIRAALQRAWGCGDQPVSGVGVSEGVRVSRRTARWQRRSSAS